ncbi:MAG TPA: hypothetical protein VFI46_08365 [Jiangellaceae bacterium]|nr:hypothetical protein [Jiangellaceae bacterium]
MDAVGQRVAHWLEIEPRHMDPAYVLWATLKIIDVDRIPAPTTVVRFELRDRPAAGYWLILRRQQPELCTRPSGYVEDIVCRTDSTTLVDLHLKAAGLPRRDPGRPGRAHRPAAAHPPVPELVPHQPIR